MCCWVGKWYELLGPSRCTRLPGLSSCPAPGSASRHCTCGKRGCLVGPYAGPSTKHIQIIIRTGSNRLRYTRPNAWQVVSEKLAQNQDCKRKKKGNSTFRPSVGLPYDCSARYQFHAYTGTGGY
eukprot:2596066-Rhodomonas_salina.6